MEERLRRYKETKAKLAVKMIELEGLEEYLQNISEVEIETDAEIIEGLTFARSDEVRVSGGRFANKIEKIAQRLENERKYQKDTKKVRERIYELRREIRSLKEEVEIIEAALAGLTEEERLVVEQYYCEHKEYEKIIDEYCRKYKRWVSYSTVKNLKRLGMEKMQRILGA